MSIEVTCDCGRLFVAPESLAGKKVECLGCGRIVLISAPPSHGRTAPAPKPSQPKSSMIEVRCACGQEFMAGDELAGKRVKCRSCGKVLDVPVRSRSPSQQPSAARQFASALEPAAAYTGAPALSSFGSSYPPPLTSGGLAVGTPEAASLTSHALPPFRKKRSNLPALIIMGSIGLVGLGGLVVAAVLVAGAIRDGLAQTSVSQPVPPVLPTVETPASPSEPAQRAGTWRPPAATDPAGRKMSDDEYVAVVESYVQKLEQHADELAAVQDHAAAAAIEIRMHEAFHEFNRMRMDLVHRSTHRQFEKFMDEYRPRIEAANRRIETDIARINQMLIAVYSVRAKASGWGKNGPPRP